MKTKVVIKWTARFLGGLAILFFGISIFANGVPDLMSIEEYQQKSIIVLLAFASLGYFFAWFREKEGGIVMIVSGIIMGMNMYYQGGLGDTKAAIVYAFPFLIPGILFWWTGRKKV